MLKKASIVLFGSIGLGGLYLRKQKIQIDNQNFKHILQSLHNYNPKLSSFFMKSLISFKMIKNSSKLHNYVFSYGFDYDGIYIQALQQLGFNSIQIGPVSLIPSVKQQKRFHLGSKIAVANLNTYLQRFFDKKYSKIGVCIQPNFQILKYTPYLIAENVLECLKQFQQLNQIFNKKAINYYVIKLNDQNLKTLDSPQYLSMTTQLINESYNIINSQLLSQNKQSSNKQDHNNKNKPFIIVQIPNIHENKKLYNLIKDFPLSSHLIVNKSQYQIIRTQQNKSKNSKNNSIKSQLVLGRKRLQFQQFIQRIINGTL